MQTRRFAIVLIAAAALSACDQPAGRAPNAAAPGPQPTPPPLERGLMGTAEESESGGVLGGFVGPGGGEFYDRADASTTANGASGDGVNPEALAEAGALLAYSYSAGLELPVAAVRPVMAAHEQACRAAGPRACQLLSVNVNSSGEDFVAGSIRLRAEPGWLQNFRDGLEGEAEAAGGRLTGVSVSAEDLTRAITDTEARLEAQRALRDRLMAILENQPGDMADLLAVERELARVQGVIDAAQSQLEIMRRRVNMSEMGLNYRSRHQSFAPSAFAPLGEALSRFTSYVAATLGFLVALVGYLTPVLAIVVPLGWWLRRRSRRRRAAQG